MKHLVTLSACTILMASGISLAQGDRPETKAPADKSHCERMMQEHIWG